MNYTLTITRNDGDKPASITVPFDSDDDSLSLAQRVIAAVKPKRRRNSKKATTEASK